jgi:hypothetical protein
MTVQETDKLRVVVQISEEDAVVEDPSRLEDEVVPVKVEAPSNAGKE